MDTLILCGAIVAAQQIVAAASLIFDNIPTQHEVRVEKKRKRELAPYKRNVSVRSGPPFFFPGNYAEYEENRKQRLGDISSIKRIKYAPLVNA